MALCQQLTLPLIATLLDLISISLLCPLWQTVSKYSHNYSFHLTCPLAVWLCPSSHQDTESISPLRKSGLGLWFVEITLWLQRPGLKRPYTFHFSLSLTVRTPRCQGVQSHQVEALTKWRLRGHMEESQGTPADWQHQLPEVLGRTFNCQPQSSHCMTVIMWPQATPAEVPTRLTNQRITWENK